jgi:predicted alpha/beta-hydrolase family hydrolase
MLFLQGTRDEFAHLDLLQSVCRELGDRATLRLIEGGDHSFKVLKRSGRKGSDVLAELSDALASWARALVAHTVRA